MLGMFGELRKTTVASVLINATVCMQVVEYLLACWVWLTMLKSTTLHTSLWYKYLLESLK